MDPSYQANGHSQGMLLSRFTVTGAAADSDRVCLAPSTDYLKSNEVLDALGVCMHTALNILICYACGVALTTEMVAGHRKNHHHSYKARSSLVP
jgi:hypothetical protein